MTTTTRPAPRTPSTSAQVAGFIARLDPAVARVVRTARRALRQRMPAAVELVYEKSNALVIGFSPTERASDAIVSLAAYARGVNLYFLYGAHLQDPDHLLQGQGTQGRFVRLLTAERLHEPGVWALLEAAIADGDPPLPRTGRTRTILKSVSAKPRPRSAGVAIRRVPRAHGG